MENKTTSSPNADYRTFPRLIRRSGSAASGDRLQHVLGAVQPGPMPEPLRQFESAPPEERKRRALRVLLAGRKLYRAGHVDMEACLSDGTLESWWAKEVVRDLICERNIAQWSTTYPRRRADVYRVFDAAIRHCRQLRGGWFVSPRAAEAA